MEMPKVRNEERQLIRHATWIACSIYNIKLSVNCTARIGYKLSYSGLENIQWRGPADFMKVVGLLDLDIKSPYFREIFELWEISQNYEEALYRNS